jgi:hypothetical protein
MQKEFQCELLNLEEELEYYLSILKKGYGIIRTHSIKRPFLLKIPYIERKVYQKSKKNKKRVKSLNSKRIKKYKTLKSQNKEDLSKKLQKSKNNKTKKNVKRAKIKKRKKNLKTSYLFKKKAVENDKSYIIKENYKFYNQNDKDFEDFKELINQLHKNEKRN